MNTDIIMYHLPIPMLLEITPESWLIAGVGYTVVFLVLLVLFLVFATIPRILGTYSRARKMGRDFQENLRQAGKEKIGKEDPTIVTGEVAAAIATALNLYLNDHHDEENPTLTINKISRNYSPWSSKIYGVMNTPNRNNR